MFCARPRGRVVLETCIALSAIAFCWQWQQQTQLMQYWAGQGVFTAPDATNFLGHYISGAKWEYIDEVYHTQGCHKYCGLYGFMGQPILMLKDPSIIRKLLEEGSDHYVRQEPGIANRYVEPITTRILYELRGEEWRANRDMLSPVFTNKLKTIYPLLEHSADELVSDIGVRAAKAVNATINVKRAFTYYSVMVLSSAVFGWDDGDYYILKLFGTDMQSLSSATLEGSLRQVMYALSPRLCWLLGLSLTTTRSRRIESALKEAVNRQLKAGSERKRGHFLDLLLDLVGKEKYGVVMKEDTVVAALMTFVQEMGYDRTTSTLTLAAYHLATFQDYQEKVTKELKEIVEKNNGSLSYEGLMEAKHLDSLVLETLRLYPPAEEIELLINKDLRMPDTFPFTMRKDTVVLIPTYSLHHDLKHWTHPSHFHPEHFLGRPNTSSSRGARQHGTFLPYGLGPRDCIGKKFSLLYIKLALAKILLKFELHVSIAQQHQQLLYPATLRPDSRLSLSFENRPKTLVYKRKADLMMSAAERMKENKDVQSKENQTVEKKGARDDKTEEETTAKSQKLDQKVEDELI